MSVPPILARDLVVNVNEVFGPTVQGEGPQAGRRASFLRLSGCNLACSWCDTPYSWDWTRFNHKAETHPTSPRALAEDVRKRGADLLVVTGGEPLLQQAGLQALLEELGEEIDVSIETNGTRVPVLKRQGAALLYVVSPKLANSGDRQEHRLLYAPLSAFASLSRYDQAVFKFVVKAAPELRSVEALVKEHGIPERNVWCMPLGATRAEHLSYLMELADPIVAAGFNLSTRLHVLAWGSERAR